MTPEKRWPSDWTRAALPICILRAVAVSGEAYGYQIIQVLKASGFDGLTGGTVYPALNRLEADGFLTSDWREGEAGPGKKFYSLTREGGKRLQDATTDWIEFTSLISTLLHDQKG